MKIFIIHQGSDYERVKPIIEDIYSKTHADILILNGSKSTAKGDAWKKEAKEKIKVCDVVVYILGADSHNNKNIKFELEIAKKYHKEILLIRLNPEANDLVNDCLYTIDKYMSSTVGSSKKPLFKELTVDDLTKFIKYGYGFDISDKLDDTFEPKRTCEIIEQYKKYLDTSEQLLTRRQNTSNFYTTLNTSILGVASTISGIIFGLDSLQNNTTIALVIFIIISLLGFLLCFNWLSLLESYGKLNSSKIRVITEIEKRLPINIYDTEWKVMSEKLGGNKYQSFTSLEKRIPLIFMLIYALVFIGCVVGLFLI